MTNGISMTSVVLLGYSTCRNQAHHKMVNCASWILQLGRDTQLLLLTPIFPYISYAFSNPVVGMMAKNIVKA